MSEKSAIPEPARPTPKLSRGQVLKMIGGVFGAALLGSSKTSEVQAQLSPESQKFPDKLKKPIEKASKATTHMLTSDEDIKLFFYEPGEATSIKPGYKPVVSEIAENSTITAPVLYVRISKLEKEPWKYAQLLAGKALGEIVNKSAGGYPANKFADAFLKYGDTDLNRLNPDKGNASTAALEAAKLSRLRSFFDFENYANDGIRRDEFYENIQDMNEELFKKTYSIWMFASDQLVEKIESADAQTQPMVASIFLSGLISALDCAGAGTDFNSLGFNKKNIDRIVEASDSLPHKNYIKEKIKYMGTSRDPLNFEKYLANHNASANAA